jgi:hypothetical protein
MKLIPYRVSGLVVIAAGILVELIGFGLDGILSLVNENLSARGSVLTIPNPGHMVFFAVGLALTITGVILCVASRSISLHWKSAAILTVISVAMVFGVSSIASAPLTDEHHHTEQEAGGSITHTHGDEINVNWGQLQEIEKMLSEAKAATAKYSDVNVANSDGYHQEGPSRPGEGTHFINRKLLNAGLFDIRRPTFLLYEHEIDWSYKLVGVGWLLPKKFGDNTPPPYFAPLAAWHYHEYAPPGICIWKDGTNNRYEENACKTQGGMFWTESPWMLHVWLFRPNPDGIFSLVNSSVKGIQFDDFSSN